MAWNRAIEKITMDWLIKNPLGSWKRNFGRNFRRGNDAFSRGLVGLYSGDIFGLMDEGMSRIEHLTQKEADFAKLLVAFRREKDGKTEYLLNSRPHTRDETITKRRRDIFTRVRDFCDEHNYGVFGLNFNLCVDLGFDLNNVTVSESLLTQDEKTIFLTEHGEYRVDGCKTDQEAEQVIIPQEVKIAMQAGKKVMQDGGWFFIPFPEFDGELGNDFLYARGSQRGFKLPPDENSRFIAHEGFKKDGEIYVKGTLIRHSIDCLHEPVRYGKQGRRTLECSHKAVRIARDEV